MQAVCAKLGCSQMTYTRMRYCYDYRQSDEHWNHFKGNVGETYEERDGAHMGFSERIDTILNRTEMMSSITVRLRLLPPLPF